jgi:4a-hydroxytetrahydrobiopterin dehydratase
VNVSERIGPKQFHEAEGVEDWRVLGEGACAFFRTGSFEAGAQLVDAIGDLANLDAHHPDVDVRHDGVTVRLITITDDYYGLSTRDVELAQAISAVARELGAAADPSVPQTRPGRDRRARPSRGDAVLACRARVCRPWRR